jgi:hypothetical protein
MVSRIFKTLDICAIGINVDQNWSSSEIVRKMGNGAQTSFWKDCWVGSVPLCQSFPRLFSISLQQEASVASIWCPNGISNWKLIWRRRLFVWETALLDELLLLLRAVTLSQEADGWGWRPEQGGEYTVKSTYDFVSSLIIDRTVVSADLEMVFKWIWKCLVPSKVSGLVWMVLHDRVPTRDNLFRRKIIMEIGECRCVFCGESIENVSHLFLY